MKTFNLLRRSIFKSNIDIFISHSHNDGSIVDCLIELIKSAFGEHTFKIRATYSTKYGLNPGTHFETELKNNLKQSKLVIGVISKQSAKSAFVQNELGAAWGMDKSWILLYYEDDILDKYHSFISQYHIAPLYDYDVLSKVIQMVNDTFDEKLKTLQQKKSKEEKLIQEAEKKLKTVINRNKSKSDEHEPLFNPKTNLEKTYNYVYYRDYSSGALLLSKIKGCKKEYKLLADLHSAKNISAKFRVSRPEEDMARSKILMLLKIQISNCCKFREKHIDQKL